MFIASRESDKPIVREISILKECGRNCYPIEKNVTCRKEELVGAEIDRLVDAKQS